MRNVLIAAALVALAAPMAAVADHRPDHQTGGNPSLTIKASPDPVVWGNFLTITGRLRGSDNAAKTIELHENPFPYPGPFKPAGVATATDSQGNYTLRIRPFSYTDYRTVAKTTPEVGSEAVRARVRMRISRKVDDRTPNRGDIVTFSGYVGPAHDGRTVYIQRRKADGSWRTKATTVLRDGGPEKPLYSAYAKGLPITKTGTYRVVIKRDPDHLGNVTRRVKIYVP